MRLHATMRGTADLWLLAGLTLVAFGTFAVVNPAWVNRNLVQTMISQSAALALVAIPLTFSIISRNIDLSVGSLLALLGMIIGRVQESSTLLVGVLAGIACGAAVGVLHGVLVAKLGLSAIMATLATLIWARGLTLAINDSRPIPLDGWLVDIANERWAGFTIAAPLVVAGYVVGQWIRRRTKVGLYTAAIGGGPDAARRSGIPIDRYVVGQFVATGVVVAIAAALTVGQLGSASPYTGTELELDAIIAVVIGGTSLAGGYGSVGRSAVGVTFMSVMNSGLLNLGLTDSYYQTARGLALLGVLALQIVTRRLVGPRRVRSDAATIEGEVSE
jgi:ribose transport system ATP-binding protein